MPDQKKTVFITGGSTGIGAASVRKFAQCGWNVTFMDINVGDGQAVAQETGALFVEGNTRNREDLDKAVAAAIEKYGELDCVVANAGIHRCNTMLTISEEELDLMIDTNIKGTVRTLQAAVPSILRKGGGSVVINASDQSYIGKANSFGYGLTKGALGKSPRVWPSTSDVRMSGSTPFAPQRSARRSRSTFSRSLRTSRTTGMRALIGRPKRNSIRSAESARLRRLPSSSTSWRRIRQVSLPAACI